MRTLRAPLALCVGLAAATPVLLAQPQLAASAASQIIDGCVVHAQAKGQSHAIVVYDDGGHPVALLRMDGNAPGIVEFAMQKAEAVAHWRFSTADMATAAGDTPGFADAPHVVTVAGGVPIYSADGRSFMGAVGVSGEAPTDDAACAEAGIRSAGLSPTRKPASATSQADSRPPEVQRLGFYVGRWSEGGQMRADPTGPFQAISGDETCSWAAGGYAVACDEKTAGPGGGWEGVYILSYDAAGDQYHVYGTEKPGSNMHAVGRVDGDRWVWETDPAPDGSRVRYTFAPAGADARTMTVEAGAGDRWSGVVNIEYTRRR